MAVRTKTLMNEQCQTFFEQRRYLHGPGIGLAHTILLRVSRMLLHLGMFVTGCFDAQGTPVSDNYLSVLLDVFFAMYIYWAWMKSKPHPHLHWPNPSTTTYLSSTRIIYSL